MKRIDLVEYFLNKIFDDFPKDEEEWWDIDQETGIYTHVNTRGKFVIDPPHIDDPEFNYKMFIFMNRWKVHRSACWFIDGVAITESDCEEMLGDIDGKIPNKIPRNLQWFFDKIEEI